MARFGQDGLVVLNVAEKNDAAKRLSQIMSNGHSNRREGFSKFNKIYEFDYNLFNRPLLYKKISVIQPSSACYYHRCFRPPHWNKLDKNCKMAMTSVSGHLIDIQFSGAYTKWNQCPPVALFDAPVTRFVPDNFKDIKRTLEREVRRSQALIIWTDGDREGENIGFEIIEVCRQVKENIDVYRARFSEITPRAVNQACRSLVRPDEDTSNAVEVRRELDLRIGASFTRFQTLRLQKKFPTVLAEQLISYGSCQFPTLGFVVARYKQVQEFLSEIFYKIKVTHTKNDCIANFVWQRGRVFNERICSLLTSMCQENPHATIVNTISKPKSKWRPVPLDTVELEKSASRKLRINAKETMKIAEKLYTNGIISYPRTETNIFPKGMDLNQLVQNQTEDNQWGGFASGILANGGANPRQGKKTDNAHPPIHPIKHVNNLQGNEKRVYEFIVRHFLACVSKDAQGHETVFEIELAGEMFSVQGLVITERNYLDVYPYENWNNKSIPIYQQGETFTPDSIEMITGETNPPPLLSEADLITLMEKHGIGTDATHADHIEKIKSRNYVGVQNDGTFLPGQLGMALVEGYDAMGFAMSKPHLRASLEADLVCICNGTKNHQDVLAHQIQSYKTVFEQTMFQVEKLDSAMAQYFGEGEEVPIQDETNDVRKCPKCKAADMVLRKTKEAKWMLGCMGYPECRTSFFFPAFTLQCARSDQTCSQCSHTNNSAVHKIDFHFRRASVPPAIGERYTGCVGGCDEMLMGALSIREATANRPAATQNNNNSRADLGRGAFNQAPNVGRGNQVNRARGCGNQGLGRGNQGLGSGNQGLGHGNQGPHGSNQGRGGGKRGGKFNNDNNGGGSGIMSTNTHVPSGDNQVVCSCNKPTVQLTVRKDGPNQGRQFYKCSDSQCNFFLWSDVQLTQNQEGAQQNRGFGGTNNRNNNRSASFSTDEPTESVPCNCSQPATIRTVTKEGGNKGRQFYVCARGRDEQCKFFQWAEEESVSRGASRGRGGGGGGGGVGRGGGGGRKRKCGGCGQEGHTKRSCPFMK